MGESLRIALIVHHELREGTGAAGSTLHLADALRARGHHVDVIGLELAGGGESLRHHLIFPFLAARRVRAALRRGDYDVIDAATGDLWLMTTREVRQSQSVVITRSHGLEPLGAAARRAGAARGELRLRFRYRLYHGGWRLHEVRRSLLVADAVLVLNGRERQYVTALGVPDRNVMVSAPLMGQGYVESPDATQQPRVLVTGGTQWRKGGADNGRVVRETVERHPDAHVTWLGVDDATCDAIVPTPLRGRLSAVPSFSPEEASALLADHRVVVHLSRFEGWGMLVVEALSHGCLVVGTDVGIVGEAIGDSGYIVPVGDVDAALHAVSEALAAPDVASRSARASASAHRYDPRRVVALLEENYREALRAKHERLNGTRGAA